MIPKRPLARPLSALVAALLCATASFASGSFVNWENPHVHPIDLTPSGDLLLVVNTPDNRLEVFDLTSGLPRSLASVPVGLDPVSVRARNDDQAWVVNHVSDSVSVVDLGTMSVIRTLPTLDEPADVVFAGDPARAFVSCSQVNRVMVFDPDAVEPLPEIVRIDGEDPRALAVSPDGDRVYAAVFESGNATTILAGSVPGAVEVVDHPDGPYGGVNPPPNSESGFEPPLNPGIPDPDPGSLIVRKSDDGRWLDDNGADWTEFVSGSRSELSERPEGWDLPDYDLAVIDAASLQVGYVPRLMNSNMAVAVQPGSGRVAVVGTDATNEIRFEPNIKGTFVRVNLALVDADSVEAEILDLNPHLTYETSIVSQAERDLSLGDPRGIVWNADGTRAYVTGMGSNNVVILDEDGHRVVGRSTIEVGEGPTGVVLDDARDRLYVVNKFEASVSTIALDTDLEIDRVEFFDPSPEAIKAGRKHLYDTHETSGLGQASCASCHLDSRLDRLAWDLGDPTGEMKPSNDQNVGLWNPILRIGFRDWHPMKGAMLTQTLQDIIGLEPFHWRGDRDGIEEFNDAFESLLGDDEQLTDEEMQEFEDFLATIHFPPNPFRRIDNSLPTDVPLPGHFAGTDRFAPRGTPLPNGNAQRGVEIFTFPRLTDGFACSGCHTLPTGLGPNKRLTRGGVLEDIPPGPNGELHLGLQSGILDVGFTGTIKMQQLRNMHERVGFETTQKNNLSGFGYIHDGSVDSLARFMEGFAIDNLQEVADLVAFMLAFAGSDLPEPLGTRFEPEGPPSQDTHAGVGKQTTVDGELRPIQERFLRGAVAMAENGKIDLVAKGLHEGVMRGYAYAGGARFQSDRTDEALTVDELLGRAAPGSELTFTIVPHGSGLRIGIDRDEDGIPDGDEE